MIARTLLATSALLCAAGTLTAQVSSPWFVRFEGGAAEIHGIDDWGPAGGIRLGRHLDRGGAAALTLGGGGSDAGYGTLTLGLDLQLPGSPRLTPTLGGRAGLLVEEGFAGDVLEANAGLAFRIGTGKWLRAGVHMGRHSDADGPNAILIGYQAPL